MPEIAQRQKSARVAPVIRTSTEATARACIDLLADEGFTVFEITLTTPGALDIIRDLAAKPGILVGVGTVLNLDRARRPSMRARRSSSRRPSFRV